MINAGERLIYFILDEIAHYHIESIREITDLNELNHILETTTKLTNQIKNQDNLTYTGAQESIYQNGLKYIVSEMTYKDDKNVYTLIQHTFTTNYYNTPIVNIIIETQKKAIEQLLVSSKTLDTAFPKIMRTIEIEKTNILINDTYHSAFETYKNLDTGSFMLEKYMQYYPVSNCQRPSNKLLELCGCGSRYLEIMYHNQKPLFAQFSDQYKVEMANFSSNAQSDVKRIIHKINEEVDLMMEVIHTLLKKHTHSCLQKRIK